MLCMSRAGPAWSTTRKTDLRPPAQIPWLAHTLVQRFQHSHCEAKLAVDFCFALLLTRKLLYNFNILARTDKESASASKMFLNTWIFVLIQETRSPIGSVSSLNVSSWEEDEERMATHWLQRVPRLVLFLPEGSLVIANYRANRLIESNITMFR